jgi:hypothetical protein
MKLNFNFIFPKRPAGCANTRQAAERELGMKPSQHTLSRVPRPTSGVYRPAVAARKDEPTP